MERRNLGAGPRSNAQCTAQGQKYEQFANTGDRSSGAGSTCDEEPSAVLEAKIMRLDLEKLSLIRQSLEIWQDP